MKRLGPLFLVCALVLASVDAGAARMGGGRSLGRQSANVTQRQATPPASPSAPMAPSQSAINATPRPATPAPAAAAPRRPWGAMLGGLAAGLGLAWLAHSLGLGGAFGNILLIALLVLVVMAVWRMFSARSRPAGDAHQGGFAFEGAGSPANPAAPCGQRRLGPALGTHGKCF
jgi:predicted lipid-binding transport protein (Tim44 family)